MKLNTMGTKKCHLFLVFFVLFLLSLQASLSDAAGRKLPVRRVLISHESERYAVIFDAGSTGSRVHVFRFDANLVLLPIGNDIEFFLKTSPGLSSYANDPKAAADSLEPLLEKAEETVPKDLHSQTPLKLGATAGLRLLNGDAAEKILQAVRDMLKNKSTLKYKAEWVSILDGTEEGSYLWVAMNYLLGSLGREYPDTIGTIDLGGGSVQMAYAIPKETAATAPKPSNSNETYVVAKTLLGQHYYIYVHSYLNYGMLAARGEIFKVNGNTSCPCILEGYDGVYTYNGAAYVASAPPRGASLKKCWSLVRKALKIKAPCPYKGCTFNGVWNGGGGAGQKNLYVASFFFDTARMVGIVDPNVTSARVQPIKFKTAAKIACSTKVDDIMNTFPNVDVRDIPYMCMDLVYQYSLLVDGFGLNPFQQITLVTQVKYKKYLVGAAWPLGCAIDIVSTPTAMQLF